MGGLARFEGRSVVVIGHQKGRDTREKIARNFGMPHPEGYRKAQRLFEMAAKFGKPIFTFIDTPGAYPGIGAEERGQAEAIARNLQADGRPPGADDRGGHRRGRQRRAPWPSAWATACSCSSTRSTR